MATHPVWNELVELSALTQSTEPLKYRLFTQEPMTLKHVATCEHHST